MDLPKMRRDDDHPAEQEFTQLRSAFAGQLESWPDFVRTRESEPGGVAPLVELEETDDRYVLEVELPGCRRQDVDLQVDSGRLRITAERRERQRVGLLRSRTRTTGHYALTITLPGAADGDGVTASLDHGVLTVVVPKAERARRRRIPVRTQR